MGEWAKEGVKCEAQWRREGEEEWRGEAIDRTGCVDYMKAKCRCPHDTIRVAGECEGLERGTPRSGGGICGKNLELCMHAAADDRTVPSGGLPHGVGQRRKPMQGRRKRVLDHSSLPARRWI